MRNIMESRALLNKLFILGYIALSEAKSSSIQLSWIVITLLFFLSLTMMITIIKSKLWKNMMILSSMALVGVCYALIDDSFILFLPIHIYELIIFFIQRKRIILLLALAPALFVTGTEQLTYILVSVFSFLVFVMEKQYVQKLENHETQNDQMKRTIQKLQKQLHNNDEYIKQSKYTFQLEERNRLSQDIHDKIGHSMTSALIQMEAAKSLWMKDRDKSLELLQNAINISKDGIEKIRATLKEIKPATEQMGIQQIRLFLDDFTVKHDLQTTFLHRGDIGLISPFHWKIIYQNIRECLTNVMKYANATVVSVEIHVLNQMVKVEVIDNGIGATYIKKGIGITGMEQRTATLNGTVIADGTNGFSVTMLFPI